MHIGLIVGIGPAATDYYYRSIIANLRATGDDLALTMAHADTPTLLRNQEKGDVQAQVAIYLTLAQRLSLAGAEAVAITSIGGHFCVDEFAEVSPLPVIDMCAVIRDELAARTLSRVGLLGTRTVMESHFFGALGDIRVVDPAPDLIQQIHDEYVTMAQSGVCTPEQRSFFHTTGEHLLTEGHLDAIVLAGTDLALAFNGADAAFPIIDCAAVHARAIADAARAPSRAGAAPPLGARGQEPQP